MVQTWTLDRTQRSTQKYFMKTDPGGFFEFELEFNNNYFNHKQRFTTWIPINLPVTVVASGSGVGTSDSWGIR